MNANEALKVLEKGTKVRTVHDGEGVFYQMYQCDDIARLVSQSYCSATIVSHFTPNEFVENHKDIDMVETNI